MFHFAQDDMGGDNFAQDDMTMDFQYRLFHFFTMLFRM